MNASVDEIIRDAMQETETFEGEWKTSVLISPPRGADIIRRAVVTDLFGYDSTGNPPFVFIREHTGSYPYVRDANSPDTEFSVISNDVSCGIKLHRFSRDGEDYEILLLSERAAANVTNGALLTFTSLFSGYLVRDTTAMSVFPEYVPVSSPDRRGYDYEWYRKAEYEILKGAVAYATRGTAETLRAIGINPITERLEEIRSITCENFRMDDKFVLNAFQLLGVSSLARLISDLPSPNSSFTAASGAVLENMMVIQDGIIGGILREESSLGIADTILCKRAGNDVVSDEVKDKLIAFIETARNEITGYTPVPVSSSAPGYGH